MIELSAILSLWLNTEEFRRRKHKQKTITQTLKTHQNLSEQTQNSKVDKVSVCILEYRTYGNMDIHVYELGSTLNI